MSDRDGFPINALMAELDAEISGDAAARVSSIAFDSRKVEAGGLFVALRGGYADGHDYLSSALHAGAVAALVEPETPDELVEGYRCVVRCRNTRGALAPISAAFYGHPSKALRLVGITGTDGKTTTSWYLKQILDEMGLSTGLITTVAVRVPGQPDRSSARQTTPESLDVQRTLSEMVAAGAVVAVLETTSHALETHRVDGCAFDVAAVTNITREHLDFHGSVENYRAAKGSLLHRVALARAEGKLGTVVLNADDPGVMSIAPLAKGADILWYSRESHDCASVHAGDIVTLPDSSTFTLVIHDERFPVRFPLPGSWNVSNCLAAVGVAVVLGCDPADIAASVERLEAVPGRMQAVDVGQPFTVLVDYAHTPESLQSVLTEARRLTRGRVLVAFGSAGERDIEKRALQGGVAARLADLSIFTSEDPRFEDPFAIITQIASGAAECNAVEGVDFHCIEDRREAVHTLLAQAQPGDVVVLAGKGHEQNMIYGSENRPWDEAAVAREALQELGFQPEEHEGTSV